jgi:hypothetical protein
VSMFLLVAGLSGLLLPGRSAGLAQEARDETSPVAPDPQWPTQVEKMPGDEPRNSLRGLGTSEPLQTLEDENKAADARAMKNPSLQRG